MISYSVATVEPCSASFHSSFHSDSPVEVLNMTQLVPSDHPDSAKNDAVHETEIADSISSDDRRTLRKIADKIPYSAFLVALVELCERFAFYGLSGPFQVADFRFISLKSQSLTDNRTTWKDHMDLPLVQEL